jgi:ABC-type polysaccharide/polyol phosphate export permease
MTRWLIDTYVVWSIHFQGFIRDWPFFLLISLISGGTFFMLRLVTNAPPELETRLLAGAMVFGVGMQSINMTGQLMVSERFQGQMKLFKTSPIAQGSYVVGVTIFAAVIAALTAVALLGMGAAAGVDFHLSLILVPLIIMTGVALTGFAVLIATYSRTAQMGNMLTQTIGIIVIFISPIFYPIERLPEVLQWLARLSPFTHAGQAFYEVLSGGSSILGQVVILLAFMVVTNALGIAKMRWREP